MSLFATADPGEADRLFSEIQARWRQLQALPVQERDTADRRTQSRVYHTLVAEIRTAAERFVALTQDDRHDRRLATAALRR